jgi:hypothetical protein
MPETEEYRLSKKNEDFFEKKNSWSEIKDKLLGCYLAPYFQKLIKTRQPIFYVDCFAGKGKFDDGKPGSACIALAARDTCLGKTTALHDKSQIDVCFIDINYADDLAQNTASFQRQNWKPFIIAGKYEEKIEEILSEKRGVNVFLYIDPYGIRALDFGLFEKFNSLGFHSLEMLINFNSFGFFRDACRVMKVNYQNDDALNGLDDLVEYDPTIVSSTQQSEKLLTSIADGDYWKQIVADYQLKKLNGYQAERRLSTEYKQRLRLKFAYVLDMPIRLKPGQRPKYRMIHVSDHEDGCFLMAQNMQKERASFLSIFNKMVSVHCLMSSQIFRQQSKTTS